MKVVVSVLHDAGGFMDAEGSGNVLQAWQRAAEDPLSRPHNPLEASVVRGMTVSISDCNTAGQDALNAASIFKMFLWA